MTIKEKKIEKLAKKFGTESGYVCNSEERCSECILLYSCCFYKCAKMAIDFGYEDKEETKKEVISTISSRLKSHMYYPYYDEPLISQKVVDEEDVEREIELLIKGK